MVILPHFRNSYLCIPFGSGYRVSESIFLPLFPRLQNNMSSDEQKTQNRQTLPFLNSLQ